MFKRVTWLTDRFILPLAVAGWTLIARWGNENVAYAFIVFFVLLLRMYFSYRERPECPVLASYTPFRRAVERWHAYDVLGLFILMLFEGVVAIAASVRSVSVVAATFGLLVPYTILIVFARNQLFRAREMVAESQAFLNAAEPAATN